MPDLRRNRTLIYDRLNLTNHTPLIRHPLAIQNKDMPIMLKNHQTASENTARNIERLLLLFFFGCLFGMFFQESPFLLVTDLDMMESRMRISHRNSLLWYSITNYRYTPYKGYSHPALSIFFSHLTHSNLTNADMPMAFSLNNTVMLLLAVLAWRAIASHLKWSPQIRLISFAGLFLNFAILKNEYLLPYSY